MRCALVPRSLRPTRDFERTSRRLPASMALTRMAMSSLKPNHLVVSTASMVPAPLSRPTTSQPMASAAASATSAAAAASGRNQAIARMLAEERGDEQIQEGAAQRRRRDEREGQEREE